MALIKEKILDNGLTANYWTIKEIKTDWNFSKTLGKETDKVDEEGNKILDYKIIIGRIEVKLALYKDKDFYNTLEDKNLGQIEEQLIIIEGKYMTANKSTAYSNKEIYEMIIDLCQNENGYFADAKNDI